MDNEEQLGRSWLKKKEVQAKEDYLNKVGKEAEETIKVKKNKVMKLNAKRREPLPLIDKMMQNVDKIYVLGVTINRTGGSKQKIRVRLREARGPFNKMNNTW